MTQEVIACCVDSKKLKKEGIDYLKGNKELEKDALELIQLIQLEVDHKTNSKLHLIENTE